MENLIQFNESEIDWKPAPGPDGEPLDHVSLSFLNVDENAKIVDLLFKFSANEKVVVKINNNIEIVNLFTLRKF